MKYTSKIFTITIQTQQRNQRRKGELSSNTVTFSRLITVHDCTTAHLHSISILSPPKCTLHKDHSNPSAWALLPLLHSRKKNFCFNFNFFYTFLCLSNVKNLLYSTPMRWFIIKIEQTCLFLKLYGQVH